MERTRIVIVGFGNIGKSVFNLLPKYPDLELVGIISRDPERVLLDKSIVGVKVFELAKKRNWIKCGADVALLCGGSKDDLPVQGPLFAHYFNTVCSFDNHSHIGSYTDEQTGEEKPGYRLEMNEVATRNNKTTLVCFGWDPGTFSMMRALFSSALGVKKVHAFYGLTERGGVSMGHSNAILTVPGVDKARSYTHAFLKTIDQIRSGSQKEFSDSEKHWRECVVVLKKGAKAKEVEKQITTMPGYFAPYHTVVRFVSAAEFRREHMEFFHDGLVIAVTDYGFMEFKNVWESNPMGTAGILLAAARAAKRMNDNGAIGAFTPLEVPVGLFLHQMENSISLV